jgi:hypothetical protein
VSELRVPTLAMTAEVTCLDGRGFRGRIFVPASSALHDGPMRAAEWMNGGGQFFPFLPDEADVPEILNKKEILVVSVKDEGSGEPVDIVRRVVVECGARRLEGTVFIDMPTQNQRVLDYLNRADPFLALYEADQVHLVQKHNITRVIEVR